MFANDILSQTMLMRDKHRENTRALTQTLTWNNKKKNEKQNLTSFFRRTKGVVMFYVWKICSREKIRNKKMQTTFAFEWTSVWWRDSEMWHGKIVSVRVSSDYNCVRSCLNKRI